MAQTKMLKAKAIGPNREGCHDLPEIDVAKFHSLGGQDIVTWGENYTIEATQVTAIEYVVAALNLEFVEFEN